MKPWTTLVSISNCLQSHLARLNKLQGHRRYQKSWNSLLWFPCPRAVTLGTLCTMQYVFWDWRVHSCLQEEGRSVLGELRYERAVPFNLCIYIITPYRRPTRFSAELKKLSPITENTNSTDSFCLTFSCISSFSLSFVFTLFAKLFSLFSNSFSSINSSNRVTCLSRKMYRKIYKPGRYSHKVDLVFILFNRMRKLLFSLGYNPRFLNQNSTQLSRKPFFARFVSVSYFPH